MNELQINPMKLAQQYLTTVLGCVNKNTFHGHKPGTVRIVGFQDTAVKYEIKPDGWNEKGYKKQLWYQCAEFDETILTGVE